MGCNLITPSVFCSCGWDFTPVEKQHLPVSCSGWKAELFLTHSYLLPPLYPLPSPTGFSLCTNPMHLFESLPTAGILPRAVGSIHAGQPGPALGFVCTSCLPSSIQQPQDFGKLESKSILAMLMLLGISHNYMNVAQSLSHGTRLLITLLLLTTFLLLSECFRFYAYAGHH